VQAADIPTAKKKRMVLRSAIVSAAVLGIAAAWFFWAQSRRESGPPARVVPFTSSPGDKGFPAFSPDGNEVAFSWQGESNADPNAYNIYVLLVGAGTPLRLTKGNAADTEPAWSPDGRFIAFYRDSGRHKSSRETNGFYIVPALGGAERKVAEAHAEAFGGGLSWSPDGKYLAVVERASLQDAHVGIFFISVESGQRQDSRIELPAAFVDTPSFSPDGKYLAFVCGAGFLSNDVYVAPLSGGRPRQVTSVHALLDGLAWTPDGKQILFSSNHQGLRTLWKVGLNGGQAEQISIPSDAAVGPAIALHGNRMAFLRYVRQHGRHVSNVNPT
jgi:Tol biopolymer transport system component